MRILHIGDIVGRPGRQLISARLQEIRFQQRIDCVIANGENVTGGSGINPENFEELIRAGVDCVTLGDHIYRRKQIDELLRKDSRIVKPVNFPASAPGRPWTVVPAANGLPVAVISVMGRVFMRPVDCPFDALDRALQEIPPEVRLICVDLHAEATSDKQLIARYLDGRVTSVLGTHTHVTTADEQILPHGTAFQCDIGMTGPHMSILGRRIDRVLFTTRTFYPSEFDVASEQNELHASIVDADPETGRALAIERFVLKE
jgi:2',3'-cyclic-nucleotide 2'-phosphodiesterase